MITRETAKHTKSEVLDAIDGVFDETRNVISISMQVKRMLREYAELLPDEKLHEFCAYCGTYVKGDTHER